MKWERQSQKATMLLLVAAIVVFIASASAANPESNVQRYIVNGKEVSQSVMEQAKAAAMSALDGQPNADDRSLLLHKAVAKHLIHKKLKKKKKNHFKSSLKSLHLLPLLGIGGAAATAAAAANTAVKTAGATPAFFPSGAAYSPILPENAELPIWKVHKYNGIEIRPVRLSNVPLPPPSESDFKQVVGNAPKEVLVPEPIVEPYPSPADTIVFPETPKDTIPNAYGVPAANYGPPALTYGPPAQTYGPPAQTYGPPAQTYGPPAQTYGTPIQTYGGPIPSYSVPSQSYPALSQFQPSSATDGLSQGTDDTATAEGLEALSNLGALTDFLPGGSDSSGGLFSGQNRGIAPLSFFNRFIRGPQPAAQIDENTATSTVFRQPSQSAIQNLLGRIPIISSLTSFGNQNPSSHVNIPPLPELPALPEISNVRGPNYLPQIPHIRLPTKYLIRGSPYVSIQLPPQPQPAPNPTEVLVPEPVLEPVKPEPSYPLPLEQPQPQLQYGLTNSYGQPIVAGSPSYFVTPVSGALQLGAQLYPNSVVGIPASVYGLPGGDSIVAASETDPATATDCADGKPCVQKVVKVAVPEGVTRAMGRSQSVIAPSPVYKKEETVGAKETSVENMAKHLDPAHPSATKTQSVTSAADDVDAKPSTATEDEDAP